MIKFGCLLIPVFILVLYVASSAHSYHISIDGFGSSSDRVYRHRSTRIPVDFRVHGMRYLPIVESACKQWNELDNIGDFCGNLSVVAPGTSTSSFLSDNINDIVFDEDGSLGISLGVEPETAGITVSSVNSGNIMDVLIYIRFEDMNSALQILTHELGHAWGLDHTPISPSFVPGVLEPVEGVSELPVMFPFVLSEISTTLDSLLKADDRAAVLLLYGQNR